MAWTPTLHMGAPEPAPPDEALARAAEERKALLREAERILRRAVGAAEARLWLCSAAAAVPVPPRAHPALFVGLLRRRARLLNRDVKRDERVAKQVLRMLCDSRPRQAASLLLDDSKMLCRFFAGQTRRVLQWFRHFAGVGEMDHQLGARALARYAFLNRESAWHELEWKGNRSQAPATVASKPHYFAELDVLETIDNFLRHVPSFWSSEQLRDSLRDGQFLALDVEFFVEELLERMARDDSGLWRVLETFLDGESFAVLCRRVLPILSDEDFLHFLNALGAALVESEKSKGGHRERTQQVESGDFRSGSSWLQRVLSEGVVWESLTDAIFCNACAAHGREIHRILQDEEQEGEARLLDALLANGPADDDLQHWAFRQESLVMKSWEAVNGLALESWLLFHLLLRESTARKDLERLMTEIGMGFLQTGATHKEECEQGEGGRGSQTGDENQRSKKRQRRKSKGRSRKKYRQSEDSDSEGDSSLHSPAEGLSTVSEVSWRVSFDKYVMTWTKVDVVEHLVNHALSRWMQWTVLRW